MNLEEFREKAKDESWTPGWEAIDNELDKLYNNEEPLHYATNLVNRAIMGGNEYIDGYSVYNSKKGHRHIITYGMTELYRNEDYLGGEWNKWGYEMTVKWLEQQEDSKKYENLIINILGDFASYTYQSERPFFSEQFIKCNVQEYLKQYNINMSSNIIGFITMLDTELNTIDTIYGKVEFIQLVGII